MTPPRQPLPFAAVLPPASKPPAPRASRPPNRSPRHGVLLAGWDPGVRSPGAVVLGWDDADTGLTVLGYSARAHATVENLIASARLNLPTDGPWAEPEATLDIQALATDTEARRRCYHDHASAADHLQAAGYTVLPAHAALHARLAALAARFRITHGPRAVRLHPSLADLRDRLQCVPHPLASEHRHGPRSDRWPHIVDALTYLVGITPWPTVGQRIARRLPFGHDTPP